MRTALMVGVAVAVAVMSVAVAPPDAGAAKRKSACQKLRGGPDLAPARNVKLVKRRQPGSRGQTSLVGCVLPRGKVHVVATGIESDTTTETYKVLSVAGAYVATRASYDSQYGTSKTGKVTNLRTGRAYRLARSGCRIEQTDCAPPVDVRPAFVTSDGRAVAAISAGGSTTVAAFDAGGARTVLDAGPSTQVLARSLELSRGTVSWTGTGGARSERLPPPT